MSLGRRQFLKTALAAGLGPGLAAAAPRPARGQAPARKERIIVVGAGVAGLVAAGALRAKGFEVIVVDARDRTGGRIWTVDMQKVPVELGAEWIEGSENNPVYNFCRLRGLKTAAANEDSLRVFDADGTEFPAEEVSRRYDEATALLDRTRQLNRLRMQQRLPDITLAQAMQSLAGEASSADRPARFRNWVLSMEAEAAEAENLSRLSLRNYWGEGEKEPARDRRQRITGGFDQVVRLLAQDLDIRLSRRVKVIRIGPDDAQVETGKESFRADRVLVTLPLGVRKAGTVEFVPTLPEAKLQAIADLGFGAAHKTVLQFAQPPAPIGADFLGYTAVESGRLVEWTHIKQQGTTTLSVWSHGDAARALEREGKIGAVADALEVLRRMFGRGIREPAATLVTNWMSDPLSTGVYCYLPVGAKYEQFDVLAEPVAERLFFAGEATSRRHFATVRGAWLSGLREAERITKVVAGG